MSRVNTAHLAKIITEQVTLSIDDAGWQERADLITEKLPDALSNAQSRIGLCNQLEHSAKLTNDFSFRQLKEQLLQVLSDELNTIENARSQLTKKSKPLGPIQGGSAGTGLTAIGGFLAIEAVDILTGGLVTLASVGAFGTAWFAERNIETEQEALRIEISNIVAFKNLLESR